MVSATWETEEDHGFRPSLGKKCEITEQLKLNESRKGLGSGLSSRVLA
jgi:hypothetical protein